MNILNILSTIWNLRNNLYQTRNISHLSCSRPSIPMPLKSVCGSSPWKPRYDQCFPVVLPCQSFSSGQKDDNSIKSFVSCWGLSLEKAVARRVSTSSRSCRYDQISDKQAPKTSVNLQKNLKTLNLKTLNRKPFLQVKPFYHHMPFFPQF